MNGEEIHRLNRKNHVAVIDPCPSYSSGYQWEQVVGCERLTQSTLFLPLPPITHVR